MKMESPFMTLGVSQDVRAHGRRHDDLDRDYSSLREESDRNERLQAIWAAFDRIVQFVLRPGSRVRAALVSGA
jgi:hypothetical protein